MTCYIHCGCVSLLRNVLGTVHSRRYIQRAVHSTFESWRALRHTNYYYGIRQKFCHPRARNFRTVLEIVSIKLTETHSCYDNHTVNNIVNNISIAIYSISCVHTIDINDCLTSLTHLLTQLT